MTLQEKINLDIIVAMKERNSDKLAALRSVKAAIMLEATKFGIQNVTDTTSLRLIAKLVKQRKDSADIFNEQDRKDLAKDEINQMTYLEVYMPSKMHVEDIRQVVREVIEQLEAKSIKDIGKCMALLLKKLEGVADGTVISKLVREELA